MHPLQRRSLFAILAVAESAIQQMRAILAHDSADEPSPAGGTRRKQEVRPPNEPDYMTDEEEAALDQALEADRQRMLEEDQKKMSEMWREK